MDFGFGDVMNVASVVAPDAGVAQVNPTEPTLWSRISGAFGNGGKLATGGQNYGGQNPATMKDGTPNALAGDQGSILGMSPNSFASIAGGMASAIGPKDSWQSKLGTFARGLGVAQLGMAANKAKAAADLGLVQEMFKKGLISHGDVAKQLGNINGLDLNPNSRDSVIKTFGGDPSTFDKTQGT